MVYGLLLIFGMALVMKYILHFNPDALLFEMEGDFTYSDSSSFRHIMIAIKNNQSRDQIHLNVSRLKTLDHTALSLMMMIHDFAKKSHTKLIFVAPSGQVLEALSGAACFNALNIAV